MLPEGYKFMYTWWQDFDIADAFGAKAIKDTYKRAFSEWHEDRVAMQELTAVLNWRCWKHYEEKHEDKCTLYRDLYEDCYSKCLDHFKGAELANYVSFLDQQNLSRTYCMSTCGLWRSSAPQAFLSLLTLSTQL